MNSDKISPEIIKFQPGGKCSGRSQETLRELEDFCCPG
jgi:hypothetical protein